MNILRIRKQGLIALAAFRVALIPAAGATPQAAPHTILIDSQYLARVKAEQDSTLLAAVRYEADKYLRQRPLAVTDKKDTPPSGDKHDYLMPFALKPSEWKHQTISGFKPMNLRNDLLLAAVAYKSPVYEQAAKSISSKEDAQTILLEHQFDLAMKTGTTK